MSYPKTKDEWWQFLEKDWKDIKNLILKYYPHQNDFPEGGWPLVGNLCSPQEACNVIIKKIQKEGKKFSDKGTFSDYLEDLIKNKNKDMAAILNSAWFGMPETPSVRNEKGFFIFCDLCSEGFLLAEE